MTPPRPPLGGKELVDAVTRLADEKKAERIAVLDLRNTSAPADWFVICQGDNSVHNRAISGNVVSALKKQGVAPAHVEGDDQGRWIVIDYFDVVVHVMLKDVRQYYALEQLWSGGERPEAPPDPRPSPRRRPPLRLTKRQCTFAYPRRG